MEKRVSGRKALEGRRGIANVWFKFRSSASPTRPGRLWQVRPHVRLIFGRLSLRAGQGAHTEARTCNGKSGRWNCWPAAAAAADVADAADAADAAADAADAAVVAAAAAGWFAVRESWLFALFRRKIFLLERLGRLCILPQNTAKFYYPWNSVFTMEIQLFVPPWRCNAKETLYEALRCFPQAFLITLFLSYVFSFICNTNEKKEITDIFTFWERILC